VASRWECHLLPRHRPCRSDDVCAAARNAAHALGQVGCCLHILPCMGLVRFSSPSSRWLDDAKPLCASNPALLLLRI